MFLRRKAASWSDILLRDEIFHAGIRHCRTPLRSQVPSDQDGEILMAAVEGESHPEPSSLRL
jgi:hypothetical protein